ncbi:MAG TPA: glycosyltransferase family 2 protein [Candidatus Latescibacteria bacterium]|nr:glycosyltransferase family 2 protein [Candidatus Latescibacterota bacterium]
MTKRSDCLVVIPAYNEVENIARVIDGIRRCAPELDVVVVDDGSADGTSSAAVRGGAKVISLPFHMGYGTAVQTGYKYALRSGYDYVLQMDGDGQHEPKNLPDFLRELRGDRADVVIGSRFLEQEGRRYRGPILRRIGRVLFAVVTSFLIRQRVTDPTSGYIGLNRKALNYLSKDVYPVDYPDADVIVMLHRAGFRIKEIPVTMYEDRSKGTLHRGMRPLYYIFKMSLSLFVTVLRKPKEG